MEANMRMSWIPVTCSVVSGTSLAREVFSDSLHGSSGLSIASCGSVVPEPLPLVIGMVFVWMLIFSRLPWGAQKIRGTRMYRWDLPITRNTEHTQVLYSLLNRRGLRSDGNDLIVAGPSVGMPLNSGSALSNFPARTLNQSTKLVCLLTMHRLDSPERRGPGTSQLR